MQSTQLPKISLIFSRKSLQIPLQNISKINSDFKELIPDKILKQISRIKRDTSKENASDISLKDGGILKKNCLLNLRANKKDKTDIFESKASHSNDSHTLRKTRIESNIHAELINLFSTSLIPKLLRTDYALFIIENVTVTESLERIDIQWKISSEVNSELYFEPVTSNLNKIKGIIRHHLALKLNLKNTPDINFIQ